MSIEFKKLTKENCTDALEIYNYYVLNTTATYGTTALDEEEFLSYYKVENSLTDAYLISENDRTIGFFLLKPWNEKKEAYRHTYEFTIYLSKENCRKGLGRMAFEFVERSVRKKDIKVIMAGICADNESSFKLCEAMGFESCGHLKNVGFKFGKYLDILYYEKMYF